MTRGIKREITIDGTTVVFGPDSISIVPNNNERPVRMPSDTHLFRDWILAGLPNIVEDFTIALPFSGLEDDSDYDFLDSLRLTGGFHSIAPWMVTRAVYTATEGQTDLYLPRRRRCAASVYGLTAEYGATATLNGTPQTVAYVSGSSPATPSAGTLNIAEDAVTAAGEYRDYTKMTHAAMTAGDVLIVVYYPWMRVYVESPRVSQGSAQREVHEVTLVER